MAATGTVRRIDVLSRPKPLPVDLIEDRRSVYWVDKKPIQSNGCTEFVLSGRLEQLAAPKHISQSYIGDRPTPIWPVSENAKQASISERLDTLASAKIVHSQYKYERSPFTVVTPGARNASASERMYTLSTPKPHKIWRTSDDTYREEDCTSPIRPVSKSALKTRCSTRVESLASAKETHASYRHERSVQWPIDHSAMNAVATLRLQQLARPKSGRLKKDDYDPYKVPMAAKNANPTPRVTELALPIPRKVRQKKVY